MLKWHCLKCDFIFKDFDEIQEYDVNLSKRIFVKFCPKCRTLYNKKDFLQFDDLKYIPKFNSNSFNYDPSKIRSLAKRFELEAELLDALKILSIEYFSRLHNSASVDIIVTKHDFIVLINN